MHRACCPVSSGAQCLYNPFFLGSEAKIPLFLSFLSCDSWRRWRGGSRQLAGDAHVSVWPLPPPQPPARPHSLLCVLYSPDSPSQAPLALFLNQPSCALAEVGAGLGAPLEWRWSRASENTGAAFWDQMGWTAGVMDLSPTSSAPAGPPRPPL